MHNFLMAAAACVVGSNSGGAQREALHLLSCDTETGSAAMVETLTNLQGTTYCALSPDRTKLYSVCAKADARRASYVIEVPYSSSGFGEPRRITELPCEAPCHIALSPDGSRLAFAAYVSATAGTVSLADGAVTSVVHADDLKGPDAKRQEKAHAHCVFFTPDGSRVGVVDLGLDRIFFYDPATMRRDDSMTIVSSPGYGPRHAIFSKDGKFLFVLHELGNFVSSYAFRDGRFAHVSTLSTLPEGCKEWSKAAAIKLTDDGSILMASNRGVDSIAFFSVNVASGALTMRNVAMLGGKFPRDFQLMPGERFMVVGHKMSDEIQVYRFDREACTLAPAGAPLACWRPLYFSF